MSDSNDTQPEPQSQVHLAEIVAKTVAYRIHDNYEVDNDFVVEVRNYIIEEISRQYGSNNIGTSSDTINDIVTPKPKDKQTGQSVTKKKTLTKEPKSKGPRSAYNKFIQNEMKTVMDLPQDERMKKLASRWKAMNPEEKLKFKI